MLKLWFALALLAVASVAGASERSPYAGGQERSIKALAPAQIEDYLEGRGMGMALAAELNGYPGPRHVLELAGELGLSPAQMAETERLFEAMRGRAIELGTQIVEREAALDALFASAAVSETALQDITLAVGRLNGELRAHHLRYHLAMRDLLEPEQIETYRQLRGYGPTDHGPRHRHRRHGGEG